MRAFVGIVVAALLGARANAVHQHHCIHDELQPQLLEQDALRQAATSSLNAPARARTANLTLPGRALRQNGAAPLRMHAVYMFDDNSADAAYVTALQETVVPTAMRALARVLNVRVPVTGAFTLPRSCDQFFQSNGNCKTVRTPTCSGFLSRPIPEDLFGSYTICPDNPSDCQQVEGGAGVPDTDFIAFVTADRSQRCGDSTLAYAVTCILDDSREPIYGLPNRPLAGYINFCPKSLNLAEDREAMATTIDTAVHELLHTLVMSSSLFDAFIEADGSPAGSPVVDNTIVSEAVRAATAEHFDCPTVAGARLENNGQSATAGSHWEATELYGEIMLGATSGTQRGVLSPITLGLAEDSGWYTPNYESAGFLRYGFGQGCALTAQGCSGVTEGDESDQYFCSAGEAARGTLRCINGDTEAWCGRAPLIDCPAAQPLSNGFCKDPANLLTRFGGATSVGAFYGPTSICVGVPDGSLSRGLTSYSVETLCVASECSSDGQVVVLIPRLNSDDFASFECPPGEFLDLSGEVCPFMGCPSVGQELCADRGFCFNETCHCHVDAAGADCSQDLCDVDADCQNGQFCTARRECVWGTAPPPPPPSETTPLRLPDAAEEYVAMRAVRVGYMRRCSFYNDADDDDTRDVNERAQFTSTHGEVGLYLPGENDVTLYPIRGESSAGCSDTISERTQPYLLFQAPAGIDAEGTVISVFSTATGLEMAASDVTREDATTAVATKFGIDEAYVYNTDWLAEIVEQGVGTGSLQQSVLSAKVSSMAIITAEMVGAVASTGSNASELAEVTLGVVTANLTDGALVPLQDSAVMETIVVASLQTFTGTDGTTLPEGGESALADSIVVVTRQLGAVPDAVEDTSGAEAALTRIGQIMFAAEDTFVPAASQLPGGSVDEFRQATSESSLMGVADDHNVDLSEATLEGDQNFFSDVRDSVSDWLTEDQSGLYGWGWVVIGAIGLFVVTLVSCLLCRSIRARKRQEAARKEAAYRAAAASYASIDDNGRYDPYDASMARPYGGYAASQQKPVAPSTYQPPNSGFGSGGFGAPPPYVAYGTSHDYLSGGAGGRGSARSGAGRYSRR